MYYQKSAILIFITTIHVDPESSTKLKIEREGPSYRYRIY